MNLLRETTAQGVVIEYVEFESVPVQQVDAVNREIRNHIAAVNARQAVSPAKVAAAYGEVRP